jgi:dTDP-4-amino-4,6-dideoxy-D-galactose acyltransferase
MKLKSSDMLLTKRTLPEEVLIRLGVEDDVPRLRELATDLYTHSRYYFDLNFPRDRVQIFYQDWIEKSVHGSFDDLTWVISVNNQVAGFCTLRFIGKKEVSIGLVGIDQNMAGQQLGSYLMQEVFSSLKKKGIEKVKVVTQGRNYSAQRLYQRSGFLIDKIEIYYHLWFDESGGMNE